MSRKGQLLRGEKWFLMNADAKGNLPESITSSKDMMADINLYLETIKKEEEVKPKKEKK